MLDGVGVVQSTWGLDSCSVQEEGGNTTSDFATAQWKLKDEMCLQNSERKLFPT